VRSKIQSLKMKYEATGHAILFSEPFQVHEMHASNYDTALLHWPPICGR